jgi:hypothetical protein
MTEWSPIRSVIIQVLCPELVGAKKGFNRIEPNNNDNFISPWQLVHDHTNREDLGSNTLHWEGIWILIHNIPPLLDKKNK